MCYTDSGLGRGVLLVVSAAVLGACGGTLVTMGDGGTSIYRSTDGGFLGAGEHLA